MHSDVPYGWSVRELATTELCRNRENGEMRVFILALVYLQIPPH